LKVVAEPIVHQPLTEFGAISKVVFHDLQTGREQQRQTSQTTGDTIVKSA
jgi:hypothetical protein